jgi:PAS domain S-box-containing protein
MYGYTAKEVIGRPAYFLTPEGQQAQTHAIADAPAAGESRPDFEALRLRKDGTQVRVAISVSTISDEHGKITGLVTFHRGITAQIEARSAIEEEAAEEKQRLAELEQFQRLTVGRELKMIELKKEIKYLKKQRPTGGSGPGDQFETSLRNGEIGPACVYEMPDECKGNRTQWRQASKPDQPYTDPGPTTLSRLTAQRLTRQAVRRLQGLRYQVTIEPRTDAA